MKANWKRHGSSIRRISIISSPHKRHVIAAYIYLQRINATYTVSITVDSKLTATDISATTLQTARAIATGLYRHAIRTSRDQLHAIR